MAELHRSSATSGRPSSGAKASSLGQRDSARPLTSYRALLTSKRGVRIHLAVRDELHGCEALWVENAGELLYRGGFPMDSLCRFIAPHEEMHKACRMRRLLPHFVAQRTQLVVANV